MIPIRENDTPTIQLRPYAVYALIGVNILVFLYELSLDRGQLSSFFLTWAVIPQHLSIAWAGGEATGSRAVWITLFSAQFLHGSFIHLAGNLLYLSIFGPSIEKHLGTVKFLAFYLLCGFFAGAIQWGMVSTSLVPVIGASGSVAGVLGAYLIRNPRREVQVVLPLSIVLVPIRIPAIALLGFWFLEQAVCGMVSSQVPTSLSSGVAYWAHAGGFLVGQGLGFLLGLFHEEYYRNS